MFLCAASITTTEGWGLINKGGQVHCRLECRLKRRKNKAEYILSFCFVWQQRHHTGRTHGEGCRRGWFLVAGGIVNNLPPVFYKCKGKHINH